MFQNLGEQTIQENIREGKKINLLSNVFEKRYIPIYIITFMTSMVGLTGDVSPFSISLLGACFSNSIPLLGIVVVSSIGNFIGFGAEGALNYILTVLVMIATLFILKPKYNEIDANEKIKISKNIFIATFIIQIAKAVAGTFTVYDVLVSITFAIITVVFYKIFVNSIGVIEDITEKKAFSIEEVIATSLLASIAVSCFGDFQILGLSLRNILSILIVLVLGWKNGILVGTTAGVTIGVTLGIIADTEPIMIAAYAISGMIAGFLNRFGKIGVIVGFVVGNVVLAYVSNGYSVELIHFKEILVASVALLLIPKNINIDIEEFIGKDKLFPVGKDRSLNTSKETAERLNNVSVTLQKMAESYKDNNKNENKEVFENNKQIFISELLNGLEPYKENMLYDDLSNVDGEIVSKIFEELCENQEITKRSLLKIFADCSSYIVGAEDDKISSYLEENIAQVLRCINTAYKISKSNFVWMKKFEESKKNVEAQLTGMSKAISGIAKDIEKEDNEVSEFRKYEYEIVKLLKQKDIKVEDIVVKKPSRYIVEMYVPEYVEVKTIEEVLTKVLKENIVLSEEELDGDRLSFISEDRYVMAIASSEKIKDENSISGDSSLNIRLKDGRYIVALSDGMGSGNIAKEASDNALKMFENLLATGVEGKSLVELVSSTLINKDDEVFSTLDVAIIDLYKGKIEFIKSGACPTYIKNKRKVQIIKSKSLPMGIVNGENLEIFDKDISSGDIMLMCTDGVLDSNVEFKNKELWLKYMLEDIETNNTKKIADLIVNEAIDNSFGKVKDDMSIVVCKFIKKDM